MNELLLRRRVASAVPYDAEIEYLEGTGTQYINTGIRPTSDISWYIRIQRVDTSANDQVPFGSRDGGGFTYNFSTWTNNGASGKGIASHYAYNTGRNQREDSGWVYHGSTTNSFHTVHVTPSTFSVDGTVYYTWVNTERPTFRSAVPICLFATKNQNNSMDSRYFKGRISEVSIWLSDVLVFDAISVRVGQKGYMYDKISKQLFGNVGTGNFVLGADKMI